MRGLLLLSWLTATAAAAQGLSPGTRLLVPTGITRGGPRVLGLAGAYVGISEGAEGAVRNPAAAAAKPPSFAHEVSFDFGFALHFLPPWAVQDSDWDNDGRLDQAPDTPYTYLGTQVAYGVASLQYRAIGIAAGFDVQNAIANTPPGGYSVALGHLFGALGVSLWDDSLLLGAGVESTQALLFYFENRRLARTLSYGGAGPSFGFLWRPANEDYRVGASYWPARTAPLTSAHTPLGALAAPDAVVSPGRVLLGASWALGSTGRHYNITGREGWTPLPQTGLLSSAMTKVLISAQLDVTLPVRDAVTVTGFLSQQAEAASRASDRFTFTPRLGLEQEVLPDLLRLRLGGFLEPPLVPTGLLRPHLTFGFEAYILPLFGQRLGVGLALDFAYRYANLTITYVLWH